MIFKLFLVLAVLPQVYSTDATEPPTTGTVVTTVAATTGTGPTTVGATGTTGPTTEAVTGSTGAVTGTGTTGAASTGVTGTGTTVAPTTGGTTSAGATTAAACVDKSTDCVNKKSLCQTTGYVGFMADLCPVSCGYCGTGATCTDSRTQCAAWAKNNYCTNTFYSTETKKASCAKTCNLCSSTPTNTKPCVDTDTRCAAWNKNGYCSNSFYSTETKKKSCAKTCGLC